MEPSLSNDLPHSALSGENERTFLRPFAHTYLFTERAFSPHQRRAESLRTAVPQRSGSAAVAHEAAARSELNGLTRPPRFRQWFEMNRRQGRAPTL